MRKKVERQTFAEAQELVGENSHINNHRSASGTLYIFLLPCGSLLSVRVNLAHFLEYPGAQCTTCIIISNIVTGMAAKQGLSVMQYIALRSDLLR